MAEKMLNPFNSSIIDKAFAAKELQK